MHDEHLGYITCCPTNLGTALRASVHLNLPKLRVEKNKFRMSLDRHIMAARAIFYDENAPDDEALFDISNRKRLGITENEII